MYVSVRALKEEGAGSWASKIVGSAINKGGLLANVMHVYGARESWRQQSMAADDEGIN